MEIRGGVKLEFVRNLFDSIICDSMKINSKFIRIDSNYRVESNFSDAGFVRNSFNSIRKLIWKVKNNSNNSMKINLKFVRFDYNYRVESNFSDAGFVQNSFYSIRKFMIWLIRKVKKNLKNSIKINSKFVRFDSTSNLLLSTYYGNTFEF